MKQIRALINKETLVYVCTQKKVSPQYLIRKGGFKEDRLNKWLNISETLLPTVKQAKTLAACLHLPFAALYMNSCDIPVHKIPVLKNMRTLWNSVNNDDSELMSTEQLPVFFAASKQPATPQREAKVRAESCGDSARGLTWQSHGRRFPAA